MRHPLEEWARGWEKSESGEKKGLSVDSDL